MINTAQWKPWKFAHFRTKENIARAEKPIWKKSLWWTFRKWWQKSKSSSHCLNWFYGRVKSFSELLMVLHDSPHQIDIIGGIRWLNRFQRFWLVPAFIRKQCVISQGQKLCHYPDFWFKQSFSKRKFFYWGFCIRPILYECRSLVLIEWNMISAQFWFFSKVQSVLIFEALFFRFRQIKAFY